jgi:ComEC/Rec2-related protein
MERLVNFRLILFLALSICLGIFSAYLFIFSSAIYGAIILLLFAVFVSLYLFPYKRGDKLKIKACFCFLFVAFFILGACNFNFSIKDYEKADLNGNFYLIEGKVKEITETEDGVRLLLKDISIEGNRSGKLKYNAYIFVLGNGDFEVGDVLRFSTSFFDNSAKYEKGLSSTYLVRKIKYTANVNLEDISIITKSPDIFDKTNNFIKNTLLKGLSGDEFGVAYALLTGHSEFMDYDTLTSYRYAGVAHIFAVSGLHIGFLATAIGFLLSKLRVNRAVRVIIIFPLLLFYSGVCGFSASSIRATIMVTVSLLLAINGERNDGLTSVSLSAIIILLISPIQLFYVGFQLSFVVVLGVLILSKPTSRLFKFLPNKIANSLGTVISAQVFAIPISLATFGYFSFISVIANILFIPIVSIIFILLLVSVCFGGIFGIANLTLFPLKYILIAVNFCISILDYDVFIVGGFTFGIFVVFYYLIPILISGIINVKSKVRIFSVLLSSLILISGTFGVFFGDLNSAKIYVSGAKSISATVISVKGENTLVVSEVDYIYNINRLKRLNKEGITELDNVILMQGYNVDAQVFLTKLRTAFIIKRVFYYGEELKAQENAVKKSFPEIEVFTSVVDKIPIKQVDCEFTNFGRMVSLEVKNKKIAIFSLPDSTEILSGKEEKYDLIIAGHLHELLFSVFTANEKISYRSSLLFNDAETQGNAFYKFS